MRQVWRYVLFGLGVIGVIWGIVMLFSQVWHALIAFAVAILCLAATRLVGREEMAAEVVTAHATSASKDQEQRSTAAQAAQEQEPTARDQTADSRDPNTSDASAADKAKNTYDPTMIVRNVTVVPAEEIADDEALAESEEDDEW